MARNYSACSQPGKEDDFNERRNQRQSTKTIRSAARPDSFCVDLDREIDRLVYQLYDLTQDEIAIVEAT
jgi:hypothetical protein